MYIHVITMKITFARDRKAGGKPHYQMRHPTIGEREIHEVFAGPLVVFGRRKSALKAVGRTRAGRFLTVVFLRRRPDGIHLITAWPSNKRQILIWHEEIRKS
jgi:hypothetical protein